MKTIKYIIISSLSLLIVSCINIEKSIVKQLSYRGEILNEYEKGGDYYLIIREGNNINKYRIVKYKTAGLSSGYREKLYTIDVVTQQCYKYFNEDYIMEIDCKKLQNDESLKEYITE